LEESIARVTAGLADESHLKLIELLFRKARQQML
jgi:hypothetical protein